MNNAPLIDVEFELIDAVYELRTLTAQIQCGEITDAKEIRNRLSRLASDLNRFRMNNKIS